MFGGYEAYPDHVHLQFVSYYKKVRDLSWLKVLPVFFKKGELKRSGQAFYALCCFHDEKSPSLRFDFGRNIFHCFGCGVRGGVFNFICLMVGNRNACDGNIKAMKFIKHHFGISLPFTKKQWHAIKISLRNNEMVKTREDIEETEYEVLITWNCYTSEEYEEEMELFEINSILQDIAFKQMEDFEMESFRD